MLKIQIHKMQLEMAAMKEKEIIQLQIGDDRVEINNNHMTVEKEKRSMIRDNSDKSRDKGRDKDRHSRGFKSGRRKEILKIVLDLQKIFQVGKLMKQRRLICCNNIKKR